MSHSWFRADAANRRLLNAAIAALLTFTMLAIVPGAIPAADATTNHEFQYVIVFQNGKTVSGTTNEGTGNTAFVPNVGGTNVPSTEAGMLIHMSCSDNFNLDKDPSDPSYGYSKSGAQPELGVDTAWRIADYGFRRTGTSGGQCGNLDLFDDPSIDIEKSTNGQDADTPTGPSITVGDTVTWTYVVTNTGQVDLTGIIVTDDKGVVPVYQSGDTGNDQVLGVGEVWIYEATGIAEDGQYGNVGTVVDNENDGPSVTDTDPSHYLGVLPPPPEPGIDIEKSTNGQDADAPTGPSILVGGTVTWIYVVTNTGQVDLTGIVVTDNKGVVPVYQSGDTGNDQILGVGEVWIYKATGTAVLGEYGNIGTVVDNNNDGPTVTDTDPSHYLGVAALVPGISIEKSTNGQDADTPTGPSITVGDTVTWTYVVTNTGQVDLTGVIVTDDILGDICTIGDLDIGETETCTKTGTAVLGQYGNIGTVVDNNNDGPTVTDTDPSHYFGQAVLASGTIGDTVWSDENDNGVQDNGEKGIAGATVRLTLPDGTTIQMNTNANGLYLFSGLEAGAYKSELILSSIPDPAEGSLKLTTAGSFTIQLADGESFLDADFGVVATLPKTGVSADSLALIAMALLGTGGLAVLSTRRPQDDPGESEITN